ncbi:MAG: phosphoribosylformylglycinamidine synthase subunit PurL [Bdellovibrionales bacterium]|nr:phosphoribosylformylglycinamidine synthase subunit PurL [Bdellovibrionales bacterium]
MKQKKYQLNTKDHQKLSELLRREPTTLEIVLALALWNEHCSYRSSKTHLKKFQFPTQKKISALGEQAGVLDLGQGEKVCFKMESHNHPSYLIPYHGASTGVGGILRDIFAMNARPLALADYLCFADRSEETQDFVKKEHARRVKDVVKGISDYGNCIGIPTLTGYTEFSQKYSGNILVNVMALGYFDSKTKVMSSKGEGAGDYVVYVGSATGRDGILGADMASQSFEKEKADSKLTVQIGDPFFGKQLMEACLLSMKKNLVVACQDMGAAGLTCSSFEMSDKTGLGLSLHLDRVPLRVKNLQPEEILLSESQERMLLICKASNYKKLEKIFQSYQLEIHCLGEVLPTKEIELYWKDKLLLKIDPQLFTTHSPIEKRPYVFPEPVKRVSVRNFKEPQSERDSLLKSLSSSQGRSRKFIYRQYDQRVGTNTVKDSSFPIAVLRLPETKRELGISLGCRPYLMDIDVEQGAKDAVFYPALQLALRGFEPLAVTDCLNFGNPEKKEIMGEFVLCVENIAKACRYLDTPIISGNVSFYNESGTKNISPTPSIAMVGLKENSHKIPSDGFTQKTETAYLIYSHQFSFPGAYFKGKKEKIAYGGLQESLVKIFIEQVKKLSSLLSSAQVVGKFGLAYTLARMSLKKERGFYLSESFPFSLFHERLYEIIVCIEKDKEKALKQELDKLGFNYVFLGETHSGNSLKLKNNIFCQKELKENYFKSWSDISF